MRENGWPHVIFETACSFRARAWLIGVVVFLALIIGLGSQAGRFLEGASQSPERADVLVVLGGDSGDRTLKAIQLYKTGLAPRVLLTGVEDSPFEARKAYLTWRAQMLVDAGVPPDAVLLDIRSANTMEEAVNTRQLLVERGWRKALVVSDPPHMRRIDWAWRKAFAQSGLEYRIVASQPRWWTPDSWWTHERSAQAVITEYIKLCYYLATK
ncbi:MAG: YdcF family protein [Sulfuricaulis sp.]|uniref:YdcF family protein n=1 Tax=Sulfuricaulis sp. TaxID=2003553 RepID=UPI0034A15E2B